MHFFVCDWKHKDRILYYYSKRSLYVKQGILNNTLIIDNLVKKMCRFLYLYQIFLNDLDYFTTRHK